MKNRITLKKSFSLYVVFFFCNIFLIQAQTFDHIENIAGFNDAAQNGSVAVADYDGDLDLDIFIVALAQDEANSPETYSRLFRNNNDGSFTDVTLQSGLTNLLPFNPDTEEYYGLKGFKHGVSWGDYDNDGYPDLFFTHSYKIQLFHNLGNGTFTEVTEAAGFTSVNTCRNTGATWFDYNNDGFLDIYISDWAACNTNSLYLNNGDGTFQNVTLQTQINTITNHASYIAFPFDINADGWMDLYVSNDYSEPNSLFVNQSGSSFSEQASNYGLDSMLDDMGIAISDFNNDGAFDFFITGIDENAFLVNDGTNHFNELGVTNNLQPSGWSWGTRFADFDLDGDEDLIIVNGFEFQERSTESNVYYKNLNIEGQNGFSDVSENVQFNDLTVSVEAVDFDYDNDGDLDIFVTNSDQQSFFYENKLLNYNEPNSLNWFKVNLQGTLSNRDAIGTTLTLTTNQGVIKRYYSGVGFLSQSLKAVHFGLNTETQISELTIQWPSGTIDTFQNLDANTSIKATEGQGYVVLNIAPSQKIYGCTDSNSCNYNPNATLDDGSCAYLTSNTIDGAVLTGFFKTEVYSYPISNNSTATWTVSGGEIIEGQGTNTITVKWGLQETGVISVIETDQNCSSLVTNLSVQLSAVLLPTEISIARLWNEVLLEAIRNDYARPTVHARNLFHSSIAMYDAWAIYDENATPYLLGKDVHEFSSELLDFIPIESIELSRNKAISYAMYRLLSYRFQNSPNTEASQQLFDLVMAQLGYETDLTTTTNYQFGNAAALGNYIAQTLIAYGNNDGSRELTQFDNAFYQPINTPLTPNAPNNNLMTDPNRWQPLSLDTYIDQSGNLIQGASPAFLSPEWGNVFPFAMSQNESATYQRDGDTYQVYNDPGSPPLLSLDNFNASSDAYKFGFSMVSVWGSHLDPSDGVLWDISPGAIGNTHINDFPTAFQNYGEFYNFIDGGDIGTGHAVNPITNQAYTSQMVPRGDYTRVLAEFWADGPDSETPPGHWFTILNYVSDHELLEKKFQGEGEVLSALEWDVKSYFILGGAMHDSAISAWSIKGWYDYVRPISAIRNMALLGQSTDVSLASYNIGGIELIDGYIELVQVNDPLVGANLEHLNKIKLYSWRGPDYISNEDTDTAGVGWILAENWWPYQRPTFVTPPFAGFVSGHSTYSRAASEVLTLLTGSPFFPGGMGEFTAKKNEFLVFEQGPSVDVVLQWATYRDASDQTSLSRIWGGIHPPADDIPGRLIGEKVGVDAFNFAVPYFNNQVIISENEIQLVYPNPVVNKEIFITNTSALDSFSLFDIRGRKIEILNIEFDEFTRKTRLQFSNTTSQGLYFLNTNKGSKLIVFKH